MSHPNPQAEYGENEIHHAKYGYGDASIHPSKRPLEGKIIRAIITPPSRQEWEEEFDEKFVKDNGENVEPSFKDPNGDVGPVKGYIRSLLLSHNQRLVDGLETIRHEYLGCIVDEEYPMCDKCEVGESIIKAVKALIEKPHS